MNILRGLNCSRTADVPNEDLTSESEFEEILRLLPSAASTSLRLQLLRLRNLDEVVMDLGRQPIARFLDTEITLTNTSITENDLMRSEQMVGRFGRDNRAGINGTLHRISCIRNRYGKIVGLTARLGRNVPESSEMIEDLAMEGKSILLLGVGKTTVVRSLCKLMSDKAKKRVVIVDTSNEIAGDGDIPHEAVGASRRMQVSDPNLQHKVIIEALENHTPQVMVIDEIGVFEECKSARIVSRRGVQIFASAHGTTLENMIGDPELKCLLGDSHPVILSAGEKKMKKSNSKTQIERKSPPCFDVVVELQSRDKWIVYRDVAAAVDAILENKIPCFEEREIGPNGNFVVREINTRQQDLNTSRKPEIYQHSPADNCEREFLDDEPEKFEMRRPTGKTGTSANASILNPQYKPEIMNRKLEQSPTVDEDRAMPQGVSLAHCRSGDSKERPETFKVKEVIERANTKTTVPTKQSSSLNPCMEEGKSKRRRHDDYKPVQDKSHDLVQHILNAKTAKDILEVNESMTEDEIRSIFSTKSEKIHPSNCPSSSAKKARRILVDAYTSYMYG